MLERLRETNQRYMEELLRKERLHLLGEMADSIVHDLRSPITGMADCCARTAIGHAAAPPTRAMNSRRFIVALKVDVRTLAYPLLRQWAVRRNKLLRTCRSWVKSVVLVAASHTAPIDGRCPPWAIEWG